MTKEKTEELTEIEKQELERLRIENEYLKAELEYTKKSIALRRKKNGRQILSANEMKL